MIVIVCSFSMLQRLFEALISVLNAENIYNKSITDYNENIEDCNKNIKDYNKRIKDCNKDIKDYSITTIT